jgi:beta-lactamase regulating signal transducer with metallopeptidase domain/protocatechuate 3,4-dioxygenase beta subunit
LAAHEAFAVQDRVTSDPLIERTIADWPVAVGEVAVSHAEASYGDSRPSFTVVEMFVAVYLSGLAVMLSRIIVAAARLHRITRQTRELDHRDQELAMACAKELSLSRVPDCRISSQIDTPMATGVVRSTILLPASFVTWTVECRRSVLIHEMVHVARKDGIFDFLSQLVVAAYWFHPVVYLVSRAIRYERESATDERVVQSGINPIDYARHLVAVLSGIQLERHIRGATAMSGYGDTSSRLKRILAIADGNSRPCPSAALLACGLLLTIAVCGVRMTFAQSPRTEEPIDPDGRAGATVDEPEHAEPVRDILATGEVQRSSNELSNATNEFALANPAFQVAVRAVDQADANTDDTFFQRMRRVELSKNVDRNYSLSVSGTVTDLAGQPAAGAVVILRQSRSNATTFRDVPDLSDDVFARTTTDAAGRYAFRDISPRILPLGKPGQWDVIVASPEGAIGWHHLPEIKRRKSMTSVVNIGLKRSTTVSGVVTDPGGKPVAGVLAHLNAFTMPINAPRDFGGETLFLHRCALTPRIKTDATGRFEIHGVPDPSVVTVSLIHNDWAIKSIAIRSSDKVKPGRLYREYPRPSSNPMLFASDHKHVLDPGFPIKGIVHREDGSPASGLKLTIGTVRFAETDADGRFTFRLQPDAFKRIASLPPGFQRKGVLVSIYPGENSDVLPKRETVSKEQATSGELIRYTVQSGVALSGRIVSDNGDGIGDTRIKAMPAAALAAPVDPRRPDYRLFPTAVTDREGRYRLAVPTGEVLLVAYGESDRLSMPERFRVRSGHETWGPSARILVDRFAARPIDAPTITVPERPSVTVRCVDQQGTPVARAAVRLLHRLPPEEKSWTRDTVLAENYVTDEKGSVTLRPSRLIASNVILHAVIDEDDRHLWAEQTMPANPAAQPHTVTMKPMWRITGKVTVEGAPMRNVDVMVWRQPPHRSFHGSHSMSGEPRAVSDDGIYEWYVPPNGIYWVEMWKAHGTHNNPSGRYRVDRVSAGEYRAEEIKFIRADGTISGTVLSRAGEPIVGARVSAHPKFMDGNRMLLANPSPNAGRATTNENGEFQIEGLPDGTYQLSAYGTERPRRLQSASAPAQTGDTNIAFRLFPTVVRDE